MERIMRHPMQSRSPVRLTCAMGGRRGFTLVEVLVTTAIIVLLLSLLLVALNLSRNAARGASTRSLMQSISQALTRFESDHGYYPVLLRDRSGAGWTGGSTGTPRGYFPPPALPGTPTAVPQEQNELLWSRTVMQQWYSITALPEFLLGYGDRTQDGYGGTDFNEVPPLGFRSPGPDGVWGGSVPDTGGNFTLLARRPIMPEQGGRAQVYGPYLDLLNSRLLGSFSGDYDSDLRPIAFGPGERGYDPDAPKVFLDAWGSPLQYMRRHYPAGNPSGVWRANFDNNRDGTIDLRDAPPRLSDVFRLRPWSIPVGEDTDGRTDAANDASTSRRLDTAAFALFSPGADRLYTVNRRRDDRLLGGSAPGYNEDNIVEVGP